MVLRQLDYLTALARERHFGRAAAACHVSQPALSIAIRKLETELGVRLVNRHRHHGDLTPQGEELMRWVRQTLAAADGLATEASRLAGDVSGRLRLGVIPTALPAVPSITEALLREHPDVDLDVRSLPSSEIAAQVESYTIDAGITYLAGEPNRRLATTPVYEERYAYLSTATRGRQSIAWAELDGASMCMLTPEMQNRRIVEGALAEAGAEVDTRIETDSISALLSFVGAGWSSVVSDAWLSLHGAAAGMSAPKLVEPEIVQPIGILRRADTLSPPLVRALINTLEP